MKRISTAIVSMLMLVLAAVPAAAHEGGSHSHEIADNDEVLMTTTSEDETTKPSQEERINQRKEAFKAKLLNGAAETKLKNRCKAAQGLIKGPQARAKSIKTSREAVYGALTDHLDKLVTKLQAKGADTTKLEADITGLQNLIDAFYDSLETYTLAVNDLVAMDCEADPDAFKAALEDAREQRAGLKDLTVEIRDYLKNTVKPTLLDIRKDLAGGTDSDTDTDTDTDSNTGTDTNTGTETETEGDQ